MKWVDLSAYIDPETGELIFGQGDHLLHETTENLWKYDIPP
jgi:hypothetical protein